VYVGYIPSLKIFSQAPDEKDLNSALISAAQMFLITCYERNVLESVLKDRGMTQAVSDAAKMPAELDYISISEYENSFTVDVPVNLIAAQEAALQAA
jgi:hypothetical protein